MPKFRVDGAFTTKNKVVFALINLKSNFPTVVHISVNDSNNQRLIQIPNIRMMFFLKDLTAFSKDLHFRYLKGSE